MEIGNLYTIILTLVLVGMILGVGLLVLDKFQSTTGLSTNAVTALNNTQNAIAEIPNNWLIVVVVVAVGAIVIGLLVKSFAGGSR